YQPVVKLQLHSAGDASPLTALLLPQIFPILHPTVHKTHGGGPALRSSRLVIGAPRRPRCYAGLSPRTVKGGPPGYAICATAWSSIPHSGQDTVLSWRHAADSAASRQRHRRLAALSDVRAGDRSGVDVRRNGDGRP